MDNTTPKTGKFLGDLRHYVIGGAIGGAAVALIAAGIYAAAANSPQYTLVGVQKEEDGIVWIIDDRDARYAVGDKFDDGMAFPSETYGPTSKPGSLFNGGSVTFGITDPDGGLKVRNMTPDEMKAVQDYLMNQVYRSATSLQARVLGKGSDDLPEGLIFKLDW